MKSRLVLLVIGSDPFPVGCVGTDEPTGSNTAEDLDTIVVTGPADDSRPSWRR